MERLIRFASKTRDDFARHLEMHQGEDACFFLFRKLEAADRQVIIVRRVLPISEEYVIRRTEHDILFEGAALVRAFREADKDRSFLGFAHSHPSGAVGFSDKDCAVDESILNTIRNRMDEQPFYPSLIWGDGEFVNGRVWTLHGAHRPITLATEVGERIKYGLLPRTALSASGDDLFSRQAEVISGDLQETLSKLRVCVVGIGGTGSAVLAQITRLGVGEVVLIDPDHVERSNVNRVHGAALSDVSREKSAVAEDFVRSIGVGTRVRAYSANVADQEIAEIAATCDVIFACTDDELGRSIVSRIAYACLAPVFDMGVKITPGDGEKIRSIDARVTTLLPQEACLDCRQRITGQGVRADSLRKYAPDQAEELERAGYLGIREVAAPAVVTFTTSIAAFAINEFLHRLMGLYGETRKSSEIVVRFKDLEVLRNRKTKRDACYCATDLFRASGDTAPFLGMMWQS